MAIRTLTHINPHPQDLLVRDALIRVMDLAVEQMRIASDAYFKICNDSQPQSLNNLEEE